MYWNRQYFGGISYILVTDSEDDEAEALILKDLSKPGEDEALYEIVDDDDEIRGTFQKIFQEMLDDIEFGIKSLNGKKQEVKISKNINNSKLRIIPLGGLEQIGMNITAFESEDSIVVVDCGLSFPRTICWGSTL